MAKTPLKMLESLALSADGKVTRVSNGLEVEVDPVGKPFGFIEAPGKRYEGMVEAAGDLLNDAEAYLFGEEVAVEANSGRSFHVQVKPVQLYKFGK
jgi:hypothetical protein